MYKKNIGFIVQFVQNTCFGKNAQKSGLLVV